MLPGYLLVAGDAGVVMGTSLPQRIKVLHVTGWLRDSGGGTERLLLDILPRLSRERFEVHLAATFGEEGQLTRKRFEEAGVTIHPISDGGRLSALLQSLAVVRKVRYDILHTHHHTFNIIARFAGLLAKVPIVFTHDHILHRDRWYYRFTWRILNRWTFKNIVVSRALYDYRACTCGIAPEKLALVINGLDLSSFQPVPTERKREFKERYGFPSGCLIVGSVGRLVDYKRHNLFLEAASLLSSRRPDVRFLIAGDGPEKAHLEMTLEQYRIQDRVKLLGPVPDVNLLYPIMDVFVTTTSENEGFGLTSAEAMACAVPVVATETPANREVVSEDCGLIVDSDPICISAAVGRLLDDRALSMQLGQEGLRRVRQCYDIRRSVELLEGLYQEAYRMHQSRSI